MVAKILITKVIRYSLFCIIYPYVFERLANRIYREEIKKPGPTAKTAKKQKAKKYRRARKIPRSATCWALLLATCRTIETPT